MNSQWNVWNLCLFFSILSLPSLSLVAHCKIRCYCPPRLCVIEASWYRFYALVIFVQFWNMCQKGNRFMQKVHRQVAFVTLSSELWHLLEFNKFPVWELPFSAWIIDASNLGLTEGGNFISWLFDERGLVSLSSAECGWWWGKAHSLLDEGAETENFFLKQMG